MSLAISLEVYIKNRWE